MIITQEDRNRDNRNTFFHFLELIFIVLLIFAVYSIIRWNIDHENTEAAIAVVEKEVSEINIDPNSMDTNEIVVIDEETGKPLIDEETGKTVTKPSVDTQLTNLGITQKYNVEFANLLAQNDETVGWLKVSNSRVEYPVVKHSDNDFYLNHSFDKSENNAGWVFADYRNRYDGTDLNKIIYGHNRKDDTMFGTLEYVFDSSWYDNPVNQYIIYYTPSEGYNVYQIFSMYKVLNETFYLTTYFETVEDYRYWINTVAQRSIKNFGVDLYSNDRVLTLSTCASNNSYRLVIHAKKITE